MFFLLFYPLRAGYGSESEVDDEAATVNLPNDLGRVNRASTKSAVKLQEIGPRMTLQLVKVEEGLCSGAVIFSEYGTLISCIIVSPLTYQRNICHDLIRRLNQCLSDGRFINFLIYLHCSSFGGQKSVLEYFFFLFSSFPFISFHMMQ